MRTLKRDRRRRLVYSGWTLPLARYQWYYEWLNFFFFDYPIQAEGVLHTKWHKRSSYSPSRKTRKSLCREAEMYYTLTNRDKSPKRKKWRVLLIKMENFRQSVVIEKLLNLAREDNINWQWLCTWIPQISCAWILKRNLVFRSVLKE